MNKIATSSRSDAGAKDSPASAKRVNRAREKPSRSSPSRSSPSSAQPSESLPSPRWVLFDAENLVVGRLASEIASRLRGKGNPGFVPYKDSGEHVIVINTDLLHFTGNKRQKKVYYWHTGYPGGIKSRKAKTMFEEKRSGEVLCKAVKGMLPRGVLGREQLKKLRVYRGSEHQHDAQQPERIDFALQNPKNARR